MEDGIPRLTPRPENLALVKYKEQGYSPNLI